MFSKNNFILLRIHFSFFLLPVFLFALSQATVIHTTNAFIAFCVLHLLVYPASNAYNSFMDRDTGSIGGIRNPPLANASLLWLTVLINGIAITLAFFVSSYFALLVAIYILASLAYSYRKVRLKKYPYAGYATVIFFQGAFTYYMSYQACSHTVSQNSIILPMCISTLLIAGVYPLTQVYQHDDDRKDGVTTISMKAGIRGTFYLSSILFSFTAAAMYLYFGNSIQMICFLTAMTPVILYFFYWFGLVWRNEQNANFTHTMRMNLIASLCMNIFFATLLLVM
jgi:1,4-dihydroxy-2-naphthoate octaprenyltransferase